MSEIIGSVDAGKINLAVIVSRFNRAVTARLHQGAVDCFLDKGGTPERLTTIWVPGAFELTQAVAAVLKSGKYQAAVALGAVIRGETPHFDYICDSVTQGLTDLAKSYETPLAFGVLTVENLQQAMDRAGEKGSNKGWDCCLVALEMASILDQIK